MNQLLIVAKGLGRYRLEQGEYVLNFLNPKGLEYHLAKVLKLNKAQQKSVWAELNTCGKVKMEMVAA